MTLPLSNTGKEVARYENTRRLAHVSKIAFPNDKMNEIILRADNAMEVATNKYTWTSADNDWELALQISDYFGAIEICDGLPNEDTTSLKESLDKLLAKINRTDPVSGAASTLQVSNRRINIANELDSAVYTLEQDKFEP